MRGETQSSGVRRRTWGLCLVVVMVGWVLCCREDEEWEDLSRIPTEASPVRELVTQTEMGSISTIGDMLAAGGQDGNMYLWRWDALDNEPNKVTLDERLWRPFWDFTTYPLPENDVCTLLNDDQVVHVLHERQGTSVVVTDARSGSELKRWLVGEGWKCEELRGTRNAKYIGGHFIHTGPSGGKDYGSHKLYVLKADANDLDCVLTIPRQRYGDLRDVAISECGRYIAVVGTCNGGFIIMADAVAKNKLWERIPKGEDLFYNRWTVNFNDVCFSPDSERVYVAGNIGLLCFDVATGKVTREWPMPARVASVAVSQDGRLAAAGLMGCDYVYICETGGANPVGEPILELATGQKSMYGVAFSPDSTLLATEGVLNTNIKIWKMAAPKGEPTDEQGGPNEPAEHQ